MKIMKLPWNKKQKFPFLTNVFFPWRNHTSAWPSRCAAGKKCDANKCDPFQSLHLWPTHDWQNIKTLNKHNVWKGSHFLVLYFFSKISIDIELLGFGLLTRPYLSFPNKGSHFSGRTFLCKMSQILVSHYFITTNFCLMGRTLFSHFFDQIDQLTFFCVG